MTKEQIKFILASPLMFSMLVLDDIREALKPKVREMREMYDHLGDQKIGRIDVEKTDLEMEDEDDNENA